ncbi:ribonuclease H2 subunit A isoform X1 [Schistocerca americana]|uniref:ribonuclease H2 subunit A isoform X1 n=1 Tax=Schistocerca americana TaxID=7009 RepID=UPI001F4F3386|nr:ribonuclease H2 subunit A isoform X1 [Schistocerca americana]
MMNEEEFQEITCAEDFGQSFLNSDNSENLTLCSNVPALCTEEPCILGVDEAGRGPVLGPMVYGVSYCPKSKQDVLNDLGCADSKSLTEEKREDIFKKICSERDTIGWIVEAISPKTICNNMLKRQKYSLNQIAQDSTVHLINSACSKGVRIAEVYVDTVGMPEKYQAKLSAIFPELKITVAKKADATYPIVSAASICAKVSRDRALSVWKFTEGLELTAKEFGSGYPNDPVTKKFLVENIDPVFGFPQLVRFSWSTADKILQENAVQVEWEEEDDDAEADKSNTSITSFFQVEKKKKRSKHPFFVHRKLSNLETM